jgi:hypothetical protein
VTVIRASEVCGDDRRRPACRYQREESKAGVLKCVATEHGLAQRDAPRAHPQPVARDPCFAERDQQVPPKRVSERRTVRPPVFRMQPADSRVRASMTRQASPVAGGVRTTDAPGSTMQRVAAPHGVTTSRELVSLM